jgi:signal transduction histidine kinase
MLLQSEKEEYQGLIDRLNESVNNLEEKIEASHQQFIQLEKTLEIKDSALSVVSLQLEERVRQSQILQKELNQQLKAIEQNRQNLSMLDSQMVIRKKEVEVKQMQIDYIQKEIERQTQTIFERETVIGMQQKFIFVVIALSLLLAVALYAAYKAFADKKKVNAKLEQLVTERTIELQLSNKYFRNLFENSPVAIYQIDLSKLTEDIEQDLTEKHTNSSNANRAGISQNTLSKIQVIDANQSTLELFGFTDKIEFISNFHTTYTGKSVENLSLSVLAIKEKQTNIIYQTLRRKKSGELMDVIVRWIVMPGAEKTYSRVMVTVQDITELKKHRDRLEELVQERTNEVLLLNHDLTRANEELSLRKAELEKNVIILRQTQNQLIQTEKMASLGMLTAGIAHEINNPVNFISGSYQALSELIQDIERVMNLYSSLEPFQPKSEKPELLELEKTLSISGTFDSIKFLISNIETGVTRTTNIIQNLMTYSRTGELQYVLFDIEKNVRDTLVLFKTKLGDRITVIEQFQNIPHIVVDPTGISRVFMNIISNAIDAIPNEGSITIKTHYDHDFGQVIVIFEDTGVGISPENQRKLFDPFFTTKEVGKGTGLGMYMSYQTIEQHGGRIEVNSQQNVGTAISIYLPTRKNMPAG